MAFKKIFVTDKNKKAEEVAMEENEAKKEEGEEQVTLEGEDDGGENAQRMEEEKPMEEWAKELEYEAKDNYDKYLRAVADLENYKKRALKERADLLKYAGEYLARDVLEVLDDLERALSQDVSADNYENFKHGVKLVYDKFLAILEQHSIKSESALGEKFDPVKHEAMTTQPTAEKEPGTVLQEYRKAFFFRDKLIRPAQVVVAAASEEKK